MKYVVTGGAGFIGSNLVDKLIEQQHEVHVIDNFSTGKKENCNLKAIYHTIDIADISHVKSCIGIMKNADCIFHTAALARVQPSIENPIEYELNNTIGTLNMLKCAVESKSKRFVYSASSAAYGDNQSIPLKETESPNPISPYAAQKYYGEVLCKTFFKVYNLETVSLRYFNVYGEKQNIDGAYAMVIGLFMNQAINNIPMSITGDGEQKRDFTYVGDVVNANILAANSSNVGGGEVINIGTGNSCTINEIADMIGKNKIYIDPLIEPRETVADNNKAKKLLDWEPTMNIKNWILKEINYE